MSRYLSYSRLMTINLVEGDPPMFLEIAHLKEESPNNPQGRFKFKDKATNWLLWNKHPMSINQAVFLKNLSASLQGKRFGERT